MRVALMVTCINDALFPDTGRNVVRLLRRLGVDVEFPATQTCCGQPMINTGYLDEAVPVLRNFVDAFDGYDAVVTPSGSCAGSARHQHATVARRSGDRSLEGSVKALSTRVYELSEFLVDVLGVEDVGAYFPHSVVYHPTCHSLRMLGVGDRPTRLLRAVRGLTLRELPEATECCGFGGTGHPRGATVRRLCLDRGTRPAHPSGTTVPLLVAAGRRTPMTARDEILADVRRALADAPVAAPVPRDYRRQRSSVGLVGLFVERVEDYRAVVVRCTPDQLEQAVAAALPTGARVVVPADLPCRVPGAETDRGQSAAELDAVDAVVTSATLGIANTGTIVLTHTRGEGRRALSLVPDLHVCILREEQIVADLPDAFDLLASGGVTTWVSGPSATSDIELERVEGVHGPRTLHVVLVARR